MRALAGFTLWAGFGAAAQAQLPAMTAETAFKNYQPKQKGVNVTTPTPDQWANLKVEPIPGKADPKTPMGYIVRDSVSNKPVRQFVSYDGKSFNIIAYYLEGAEAYREVFPPQPTEPYQFRWLGANGTKWGIDRDRDLKVDEWVVISPEELSQELLQAVLTKDTKRAEALTVTKANLDSIGVTGAKATELLDRAANVGKKVGEAADALKATPAAKWDHLQLGIPQTLPADAIGARDDLVSHKTGTVMVEDGMNPKVLQTGELVQVGRAWKIVDGPSAGGGNVAAGGGVGPVITDKIKDLVNTLDKIDQNAPNPPTAAAIGAYNARRAEVLEQIVAKLDAKDGETWTQLLVDSLSAAAEGEKLDGKHLVRLKQFKEALAKGPNTALASYTAFRYMVTENSITLANAPPGTLPEIQTKWRAALEEFIKAFPKADDTPEATLRLGMAYEFLNTKEGDAKAKEWYQTLAKNHVGHAHAAKAMGAIRRLESDGKPLELTGPTLTGSPFNATSMSGKVIVVYYTASWSSSLEADAKKLKALVKEYGAKGLELVTVCLDNDAKVAAQTVATVGLPGTHLHTAGGLDGSPLAAHYGVFVVPHLIVVGKDGKIVNRNAQATNLDDEVKKLLP